nr:MAG TPA: hypothetical protein [Caudoviricetes sp.]
MVGGTALLFYLSFILRLLYLIIFKKSSTF